MEQGNAESLVWFDSVSVDCIMPSSRIQQCTNANLRRKWDVVKEWVMLHSWPQSSLFLQLCLRFVSIRILFCILISIFLCHCGTEMLKVHYVVLGRKINQKIFTDWLFMPNQTQQTNCFLWINKLTLKDNTYCFTLFMADPATFQA